MHVVHCRGAQSHLDFLSFVAGWVFCLCVCEYVPSVWVCGVVCGSSASLHAFLHALLSRWMLQGQGYRELPPCLVPAAASCCCCILMHLLCHSGAVLYHVRRLEEYLPDGVSFGPGVTCVACYFGCYWAGVMGRGPGAMSIIRPSCTGILVCK
jgi:hypothetical protein